MKEQSPQIRVVQYNQTHLAVLHNIRTNRATQSMLLSIDTDKHIGETMTWVESLLSDQNTHFLVVESISNDQVMGFVQFTNIHRIHRRAELGIAIDDRHRGQGIGMEAIFLATASLQTIYGVDKITLVVRTDNSSAIALYNRIGFNNCGVLKRHALIEEKWYDVIFMEMIL